MGWCSATEIFDTVCEKLLKKNIDKKAILKSLISVLQEKDWDCECDSEYLNNPIVREAFEEIDPDFFDYEKEERNGS